MKQIYYNGSILTMNPQNKEAESVVVEDGRIVYAGAYQEALKRREKDTQMRDLKGNTLMPGFIDGHGHFTMVMQVAVAADLSECRSFKDIKEKLIRYKDENRIGPKGMIVGFGYDHNFLEEGCHPDKRLLNEVSENTPVLINHVSGHMGVVNSQALELLGITEQSENPQGGVIGRVDGKREPNGYLEEGAITMVMPIMKGRVKVNVFKLVKAAGELYSGNGITTIQDGATAPQTFKILKLLNRFRLLKADVVAYPILNDDTRDFMKKEETFCRGYQRHLKIGGYKLILDGSPQGKSAWLSKPYEGETEYCAYPWLKDEQVIKYCRQAIDENRQIMAHCNGDAASEQFISCYGKALAESNNPQKHELRPVMIHCQTVREDQIERMKALNMIASIFVGHTYYWGDTHLKNLGKERGSFISPARCAMDHGLSVNFHQDAPVTRPDMLHTIWSAVNRITRQGVIIGREQAVTVEEALAAVTINAAYAYGEEHQKGSIEADKRADFVILDQNPLKTAKEDIKNIRVVETIKDGKTIFRRQ